MLYLLDTTTCSDLMRGHGPTEARVKELGSADRPAVCTIVRGEILYGIRRMPEGRRRSDFEIKATQLFGSLPCESIPPLAGDQYARLKSEQQRAGLSLDDNDLWIAATALALNATLVTRDADFTRIPQLMWSNWSAR